MHAALLVVQSLFGSLAVAGKLALRVLPGTAIIAVRVPAALMIFWLIRKMRVREKVDRRDLLELFVYGFFGVIANQLLFIEGLARTTATNAVILQTSIPIFTVGVAVAVGKERASPLKVCGLLIALSGAFYLVGAGRFENAGQYFAGNLIIVCNALSFSIYLVISRKLLAKYRTATVVYWTFVFGALGVIPFGAHALAQSAGRIDTATALLLVYIVVGPTVGTYFLNGFALRRAPSSLVAIYVYVQPLIGTLLAAATLHERPTSSALISAGLIAIGIALVSYDARELARRLPG